VDIRAFTNRYCERNDAIASLSYFGTFAVYFLTLGLAISYVGVWYLVVPLVIINAFSGVRLYVLQHDCGHASLFSTRRLNDLAGYGLSTFTLTPYRAMQINHNLHHANLGDLDHRETGEIHTMTLREWNEAPWFRRLSYRIYRNPLFLLPVGGLFVYLVRYRWPKNTLRAGVWQVMAHNLAVFAWAGLIYLLAGLPGIAVYLATAFTAGIIGVFLVYLQHNFEETYWDRRPDLEFVRAALQGSSALDLGWWFDLGCGNITYHDIHHFNPRIPSYRLRQCHRALRREFDLPVIKWPQALSSFRLNLWDEDKQLLVPYPPAHQVHHHQLGA